MTQPTCRVVNDQCHGWVSQAVQVEVKLKELVALYFALDIDCVAYS